MNVILKVSMANYDAWKEEFDNHAERAAVCDDSKTTVGKVDETSWSYIACETSTISNSVAGLIDF